MVSCLSAHCLFQWMSLVWLTLFSITLPLSDFCLPFSGGQQAWHFLNEPSWICFHLTFKALLKMMESSALCLPLTYGLIGLVLCSSPLEGGAEDSAIEWNIKRDETSSTRLRFDAVYSELQKSLSSLKHLSLIITSISKLVTCCTGSIMKSIISSYRRRGLGHWLICFHNKLMTCLSMRVKHSLSCRWDVCLGFFLAMVGNIFYTWLKGSPCGQSKPRSVSKE